MPGLITLPGEVVLERHLFSPAELIVGPSVVSFGLLPGSRLRVHRRTTRHDESEAHDHRDFVRHSSSLRDHTVPDSKNSGRGKKFRSPFSPRGVVSLLITSARSPTCALRSAPRKCAWAAAAGR